MTGLPSIFSLRNECNKLNNTRARMLDSIYHMILKILKNHIFGLKMSRYGHFYVKMNVNYMQCY